MWLFVYLYFSLILCRVSS